MGLSRNTSLRCMHADDQHNLSLEHVFLFFLLSCFLLFAFFIVFCFPFFVFYFSFHFISLPFFSYLLSSSCSSSCSSSSCSSCSCSCSSCSCSSFSSSLPFYLPRSSLIFLLLCSPLFSSIHFSSFLFYFSKVIFGYASTSSVSTCRQNVVCKK